MAVSTILLPLSILLGLVVLAVAIYEHTAATSLSLPITPVTALTILVPVLHLLNTLFFPLSINPRAKRRKPLTLSAVASQIVQALLTVVLGTLLAANLPASPGTCLLGERWQTLYSTHDAGAIRTIQDELGCCGLNSLVDRAWPFPTGGRPSTCAAAFGRTEACTRPWGRRMRAAAGVDVGGVLVVLILQVLALVLPSRETDVWAARDWVQSFFRQGDETVGSAGVRRPLLADSEARGGGGHVTDEEDVSTNPGDARGGGPRLEPSTIGRDVEGWGSD